MKVADLEAELREFTSEREALKLAMKILEEENQRFRNILASASQVVRNVKAATPTQRLSPSPSRTHSRRSSRSSLSVPVAPSTPGSPRDSIRNLTPVEPSPWADSTTYPAETLDVAEKEATQPQRVTRSPPPPLKVDGWGDLPKTHYHISTPPETAELDEGETTVSIVDTQY